MNEYLETLNNQNEKQHEQLEILRDYAEKYNVPIIKRDSLIVIQSIIKMKKIKRILEIGTAIGYSASCFAEVDSDIEVVTLERNPDMQKLATENISKLGLENRIKIIFGDALEIDKKTLGTFDMIFIDAAKAQYIKFFDKYSSLLNKDGVIISDNIIFHGCVENTEGLSRNVRSMVKKIDGFNHYLNTLDNYITYYLETGDGLAVTMEK